MKVQVQNDKTEIIYSISNFLFVINVLIGISKVSELVCNKRHV